MEISTKTSSLKNLVASLFSMSLNSSRQSIRFRSNINDLTLALRYFNHGAYKGVEMGSANLQSHI